MLKISLNKMVLLASVSLLPMVAYADDDDAGNYNSEVWIGSRWQDGASAKYGQYNGSPDSGFYAIGGFNVNDKSAWNSGDTKYFQATGDNLNFDSNYLMPNSSASVKYGDQGSWGVKLFLDNITYDQSDTFHSLLTPSGAAVHGLEGITTGLPSSQPSTIGAAETNLANTINADATLQSVGLQRNKIGGEILDNITPDLDFTAGVTHEHKEGTQENSMVIGGKSINAANSSVVYFPQPVDYDTDGYSAKLNYKGKDFQNIISYTFSDFTDNDKAYNAQAPFNTTSLQAGYTSSVYSLPPDNQAHQIKEQFGYNFTPTTKFNGTLSYGLMTQNDTFLAQGNGYTSNSLPQNSFDGKIETLFGSARLTSHPLDKLDLLTSYTIDDRRNQSPSLYMNAIENDTASSTLAFRAFHILSMTRR